MRVADRCHLDDLSVDQLDPAVLAEDADLAHAVVLVDVEATARQLGVDDGARCSSTFGSAGGHTGHVISAPRDLRDP